MRIELLRVIKAGLAYFGLVFGTGFLLGIVRVPLLVPRLGVRVAELIEMPIMLVAIVLSARYVRRRLQLPSSISFNAGVGLIALALLLIAELSLVMALQSQSIAEYVASRDPVSGTVYLAMLVVFAAMPAALALKSHGTRASPSAL